VDQTRFSQSKVLVVQYCHWWYSIATGGTVLPLVVQYCHWWYSIATPLLEASDELNHCPFVVHLAQGNTERSFVKPFVSLQLCSVQRDAEKFGRRFALTNADFFSGSASICVNQRPLSFFIIRLIITVSLQLLAICGKITP